MSITGVAGSILSALSGLQNNRSNSGSVQSEFKQLGQDLQAGNLSQAQQDFATLSQNLTGTQITSTTSTAGKSPLAQAFIQLGQDLQSGNLQAAQQEFTTVRQDIRQNAAQAGGHHHHPHTENPQNSSTIQQNNPILQEFSQLAQSLQGGNLQGAQRAFSALLADIQQLGGFSPAGSTGTGAALSSGSLNVTA